MKKEVSNKTTVTAEAVELKTATTSKVLLKPLTKAEMAPQKEFERLYVLPSFKKAISSSFYGPYSEASETDNNSVAMPARHEAIDRYMRLADVDYAKDPFHVWNHKGVKYIIDGRYDEYQYALASNFDIYTIEHHFETISKARAFMMLYLLDKPHLNKVQRCFMVKQLEKDFSKQAAKNKGRRTDLTDDSTSMFRSISTSKELAKLATVGEQYYKQFKRLLKDGPVYWGQEKTSQYFSQIIAEEVALNTVYRKLIDSIDIAKDASDFAVKHEKEFLTDVTVSDTCDNVIVEDNADNNQTVEYPNPDYEADFHNKIVCENNLVALKKIPSESVGVFFGSPPYNVPNVDYDIHIPLVSHDAYIRQLAEVSKELYRIARFGARYVLNIASTRGPEDERDGIHETMIIHDIMSAFEKLDIGWKGRNVIIWNKGYAFQNSPKGKASAENPYITANHEYLIVFSKGDWKATPEIANAPSDLTKDEYHQWGQSVWNIVPQSKNKKNHPCPFPEPLAERVIKLFSFVGDTVIDPWLGSGTTTAVAARLGRRWFGCDLSADYCIESAERTAKAYKQFIERVKAEQSKEAA